MGEKTHCFVILKVRTTVWDMGAQYQELNCELGQKLHACWLVHLIFVQAELDTKPQYW